MAVFPNVLTRHLCRALRATPMVMLPLLATPGAAQEAAVTAPATPPPATQAPDDALPPPSAVPMPTGEPRLEDFAPLPGNVAWPTVESTTAGEPVEAAAAVRYTVEIKGLAPLGLEGSFRGLSSLWTKKGEPANIAQINRRITEDRDLIDQLLRSIGYYGGNTQAVVAPPLRAGAPSIVKLSVDPGPLYTFASISVIAPADAAEQAPTTLVKPLLGVAPGDAIVAADVLTAQDALAVRLANAGRPFAVIGKPDIVIDHASRTGTLIQSVDLGARAVHGSVRIEGETQGFSDSHTAMLARFKPGDAYTDAGRDDLRRAMIQTSLFATVSVRPVPGGAVDADGVQTVDLLVTTEAAPVRSVAATGGYSTGQGIRVQGSWTHRNLFPPEGAFTVRGVAAEREQVLAAEFRRRNFRKRDQSLNLSMGLSAEQQDAFDASTFGVTASIDRESNIIWQKPITYSIGAEALITRQRDRSAPDDPNNTYYILALPATVTWDQSDDLLNPAKGFRLTGRLSPEFTLRSGSYFNYVKGQIDVTGYRPFGDVVLAGRLHVGGIAGASRGRIAPNRRFYAGGGGSVRGYDFQGVGPKDADGSPTGGNSLVEGSVEVRYRFQAFGNDLGAVAFVDGGQVYASSLPKFTSLRYGVGVGLRYFTSFGPIRIDVATPIARRPTDPKVAFYVSIGQAF